MLHMDRVIRIYIIVILGRNDEGMSRIVCTVYHDASQEIWRWFNPAQIINGLVDVVIPATVMTGTATFLSALRTGPEYHLPGPRMR